jgi:hypothetical protein
MNHRLSSPVTGLAVLAHVFAFAPTGTGCSNDIMPSSCPLERHELEGTALTLLRDVRLDTVGDGFVLLGADAGRVRWASLGRDGVMGTEHEIDVPPHVGVPWFAAAGTSAAMDRLVVAYVPAGASTVGMVDLMTFTVGFDNTMRTLSVAAGQIPATAKVAMVSGRSGMHAAMTFGVQGTTTITTRIFGGDGLPVGTDLALGNVQDFGCLRFSPGNADLTVGYVDLSGTPPQPTFVGTEIDTAGLPQPSFRVQVGKELPGCVELAPTDTGYGMAWHSSGIGTFFGVFTTGKPGFPSYPVLSDVRVSGPPPIPGGLGWMGKDYTLVFAHDTGAEAWPIDAMGHRRGGLPVFPSKVGNTGPLSTQSVSRALYATYADYASPDKADQSAGIRFLIKVSCP